MRNWRVLSLPVTTHGESADISAKQSAWIAEQAWHQSWGKMLLTTGKVLKRRYRHEWSPLEQIELEAIASHLVFLNEQEKPLKAEIATVAKKLQSHENCSPSKALGKSGQAYC